MRNGVFEVVWRDGAPASPALYPHLALDKRFRARYRAGHVGAEPDQTHAEPAREPGACQRPAAG